jgi:hypothetical protein
MDSGVGDQVGLEFSDIDVEGTIESQRSSQRRDDLSNESVEIGVSGSFNIELSSADIVDSFVIKHNSDISVFKEGVSGQDGVVGFNDGSGDLRRRIDSETELGLLAVIDGESFEEEGTETGTSTTTDGVEDHETLETSTVISKLSDSVEGKINDFLTNGVVTSGKVVGSIFFTGDKLFGMEELSVGTSSYFIDDSGFKIDEDGSGDVLASTSLREEGVERVITSSNGLVRGHLTVGLDTVLETVKLPTSVTDLDTGLTNVDRDTFTHLDRGFSRKERWKEE